MILVWFGQTLDRCLPLIDGSAGAGESVAEQALAASLPAEVKELLTVVELGPGEVRFCIQNEELCIGNDEFCIKNDDFGATRCCFCRRTFSGEYV